MKIGKAKYGGEYTKKKYWALKDGEQVFRILPPMGDLADQGIWSQYFEVHYGYKDSKDKMRPFQSPLVMNRKTKMVEVPDAAKERIDKLKAKLQEAKLAGDTATVEKLDKLVGQKGQFNLDKNHYVNAMDQQGNIGILKLRHRAKNALNDTIKKLREGGTDPLSVDDGRFLVFRRSGNGLDTTFNVEVLKKKIKIEGVGEVEQAVVHSLNDEIIGRLSTEAAKLDQLFPRPTSEQVERIVREGAKAVDEILNGKQNSGVVEEPEDVVDEDDGRASMQQTAPAAQTTPQTNVGGGVQSTPLPAQPTPNVGQGSGGQATQNQQQETQVTKTAQNPAPSAPQTTAEAVNTMSDEEFLKSLGL